MKLVSDFVGYRLAMTPHQEYRRAESIKVYKGIIAKIMVLFKLALKQNFLDDNGQEFTLAVNKKSLAHYIWRHNRCRDDEPHLYAQNMQNLYKISHTFWHKKRKEHKSFTDEMCYQISKGELFYTQPRKIRSLNDAMLFHIYKRKLFYLLPLKIREFCETIHKQAPLKADFYKIKNKEDKTV